MGEVSIGDLISGGGTLTFALAVWWEVKTMRQVLTGMLERLAQLEERTRSSVIVSETPARGFLRPGTEDTI